VFETKNLSALYGKNLSKKKRGPSRRAGVEQRHDRKRPTRSERREGRHLIRVNALSSRQRTSGTNHTTLSAVSETMAVSLSEKRTILTCITCT